MADNEGTDSSVETEASGDVADSDADAPPADEQESPDPSAAAGDGETAQTGVDAGPTAEVVTELGDDEVDVGGVVEDERELIDRVAEHDEDLGDAVSELVDWTFELQDRNAELEAEIESLESEIEEQDDEIDDLTARLKRKQADFQNYKKRAKKRQDQIKERATEDLVERLVDVRNDLVRAIESDHEDVESFREGVEMTLREFDRVLDDEDVEEIDPDPGDEVDPQRHEVMMQVDSARPEGAIHDVYDSGYEMAGKVLQAARVTVSNGADHDPEDEEQVEPEPDGTSDDESGDGASDDGPEAEDETPSRADGSASTADDGSETNPDDEPEKSDADEESA